MAERTVFDKIELYLVRVLHTVISERSVSKAALKLATTQPTVSAQLKRLRELTGDPLLVRSGHGMAPTEVAWVLNSRSCQIFSMRAGSRPINCGARWARNSAMTDEPPVPSV